MGTTDALTKINRDLKKYKNLPSQGPIWGVCAGIAYWRAWPTWIVRVAFVLLFLGFGFGLLAYLLIGWFAPEARTPRDYARRTGDA